MIRAYPRRAAPGANFLGLTLGALQAHRPASWRDAPGPPQVISELKAPSNNELKALNSISGVAPTLLNKNRSAVVTLTLVDDNQPS
uniref:Uncharacterized protein n=1 Tax=Solanum tuberosum TaxID=4113 RepID=M1BZP3_SOLTU